MKPDSVLDFFPFLLFLLFRHFTISKRLEDVRVCVLEAK